MFLQSPDDQIRSVIEDARPVSPPFSALRVPEDLKDFWATFDSHGWGSAHDITANSEEGYTFLSFALFYCPDRLDVALGLVQDHPDHADLINRRDPFGHHEGWTPLQWAARLFQGQAWVPTLLELGADPLMVSTAQDNDPSPAALGLLTLSFNPRMQQFFKKDIKASEVAAHALIDAGSVVNHSGTEGLTPLHGAAQYSQHLLPILLAHPDGKAAVDAVDVFGNTPLVRSLIHQPEASDLLLDAGADPFLPLHRQDAAFVNAFDVAQKLLSGRLGSPVTFIARGTWKNLVERMETMRKPQ